MTSLPDHVEYAHRSWSADPEELSTIRRVMRGWLAPFALDNEEVADLVMAVDEAATNAVEHAYEAGEAGSVDLMLWTEPSVLCIEVIDHGAWKPPAATMSFGGRGMQVMRSVVDSVMIHYDDRGTRVSLRRALPSHALPASL